MENQIVQLAQTAPSRVEFTPEQVELIKKQIAPKASNDELKLFMYQCERTGLDPFAKQIYAIMRWKEGKEQMTVQTSIDGMRLIAARSNAYAGQLGPFWCGKDGVWRDVWTFADYPFASKVGVLHRAFKEPLWGVAHFRSYAQTKKDGSLTSMWDKMPEVMIAKCAESLALRKAFPHELSGLYSTDELPEEHAASVAHVGETQGNQKSAGEAKAAPQTPKQETATAQQNQKPARTLKSSKWSQYVIQTGQQKGQALGDLPIDKIADYVTWFGINAGPDKKNDPAYLELVASMREYLIDTTYWSEATEALL